MRTITLFFCMILSLAANAQRQRNYVYVFDCTQSMDTQYHIWEQAKKWLKDDIERKDNDAIINVIPFRDNADEVITFQKAKLSWDDLEDKFNSLITAPHKNTGICRAWDTGSKYLAKGKDNFFILLTDGADVHPGSACVKDRMRGWCGTHPNSYGYVVTLSPTAKQALWTDLSKCDDISIIDGTGFIPIIATFTNKHFTMLSHAIRNIKTGFSERGTYKAHVRCNDPYYDVKLRGNQLHGNAAVFDIKQKKEPTSNHEVKFDVVSDTKGLRLCNPIFSIFIDTRDLANLDFDKVAGDEYDAGEVNTYPDFLFFEGHKKGQATLDLGTVFNKRAKDKNCSIKMCAQLPREINGSKLYLNGKEINPSNFVINASSPQNVLTIELDNDMPDDKFIINLTGKSDNLESINAEQVRTYNATMRVSHDIDWHPVQIILFWLGLLILALLILWFALLKWILYPTFSVSSITITDPYYSGLRLKGVRKVIFSNKRIEQSAINRIFTGKVLCNVNPCWTQQLVMEPAKKKIRVQHNKTYVFDPFGGQLTRHTEYVVENTETNDKIKMTIN